VTLSDRQLGTDLRVTNQSDKDELQFQALFHNYIRAPANDVKISPLTGKNYFDKTEATAEAKATAKLEQRREVDVRKPTDSVYVDGGQAYEITWPNGGIQIKTECLKDVVIWNPQETIGKTIGDMEDGGWCVRPVGSPDDLLILPQGEICLRRTWTRARLHHTSRWWVLGGPTNFER
jgi:glucose-6-phosphate 1-epimerase